MAVVERGGVVDGAHEPDYERVVELTSAQLLSLHTTEVTLIPAPGAGRAIVLHGVMAHLDYNSAGYTVASGADISLRYTDDTGAAAMTLETTGFLDATEDRVRWFYAPTAAALAVVADAVVVAHLGAAVTGGDSPLRLKLHYSVRDTDF